MQVFSMIDLSHLLETGGDLSSRGQTRLFNGHSLGAVRIINRGQVITHDPLCGLSTAL